MGVTKAVAKKTTRGRPLYSARMTTSGVGPRMSAKPRKSESAERSEQKKTTKSSGPRQTKSPSKRSSSTGSQQGGKKKRSSSTGSQQGRKKKAAGSSVSKKRAGGSGGKKKATTSKKSRGKAATEEVPEHPQTDDEAMEVAEKAKEEGKAPSTQAGAFVHEEMELLKQGDPSVKSRQQAIAIGLSKARRHGIDIPDKRGRKKKAGAA